VLFKYHNWSPSYCKKNKQKMSKFRVPIEDKNLYLYFLLRINITLLDYSSNVYPREH